MHGSKSMPLLLWGLSQGWFSWSHSFCNECLKSQGLKSVRHPKYLKAVRIPFNSLSNFNFQSQWLQWRGLRSHFFFLSFGCSSLVCIPITLTNHAIVSILSPGIWNMLICEIAIKDKLETAVTKSMALAKLSFDELGKDDPNVKELRGWFFDDKNIDQVKSRSWCHWRKRMYWPNPLSHSGLSQCARVRNTQQSRRGWGDATSKQFPEAPNWEAPAHKSRPYTVTFLDMKRQRGRRKMERTNQLSLTRKEKQLLDWAKSIKVASLAIQWPTGAKLKGYRIRSFFTTIFKSALGILLSLATRLLKISMTFLIARANQAMILLGVSLMVSLGQMYLLVDSTLLYYTRSVPLAPDPLLTILSHGRIWIC